MRVPALAFLLAVAAAAKPEAPKVSGPRSGEPYWFKFYSTAPYREIWTGDLSLAEYSRDFPKVVDVLQSNGGVLTQPLATFASSRVSRQLTFSLPRKNAPALLAALRKLGDLPQPSVNAQGAPIPLEEVRTKIAAMMKEKTERAAELARVPAAAAAEEEILEHLLLVEDVAAHRETDLLFNLTARQK